MVTVPLHTVSKTPGQIKANPYNWPHDASLSPQTTALVVIDMQRDCTTAEALSSAPRSSDVITSL